MHIQIITKMHNQDQKIQVRTKIDPKSCQESYLIQILGVEKTIKRFTKLKLKSLLLTV